MTLVAPSKQPAGRVLSTDQRTALTTTSLRFRFAQLLSHERLLCVHAIM